ncbi:MAG: hypothetical protein ACYDAQ_11015 [Mycobacteriales bacterium]
MSRRPTLPGADELFRATAEPEEPQWPGVAEPQWSGVAEPQLPGTPSASGGPVAALAAVPAYPGQPGSVRDAGQSGRPRPTARVRRGAADRQPTGRERHEEKITVYVSPEELVDLEQARLTLRAEHGLGVDRGRIVREALAVVLADLEAKGEGSILVRRLRGL